MIDFPNAPTLNQVFTSGALSWTWDGTKWVMTTVSGGPYLPIAGGTMTGDLILNRGPQVALGAATKQYADSMINNNKLINGDMRVDQRNAGASGTLSPVAYPVDRWAYNSTQVKITWGQNLGGVTGPLGFPYCLGVQSSSAYTLVANDYFRIYQILEGDVNGDLAWGSANAQPVTLQFWARSSLTGLFSGSIGNYSGTRSYPYSFSLPTANTWTKIVITIPGDTSGTWVLSGNAGSMMINFDLGAVASFRGPAGAWVAGSTIGVTGAVNVVGTNGATFHVTGVKLETGSIATPFQFASLAKNLLDCQRYYQKLGGVIAGDIICNGYSAAAPQELGGGVGFPTMRAAPTAAIIGTWSRVNVGSVSTYTSRQTIGWWVPSIAAGHVSWYTSDTTTYITLDAEL